MAFFVTSCCGAECIDDAEVLHRKTSLSLWTAPPTCNMGLKWKGGESNDKNEPALDSLQAYDQFGFPLYFDLRPGSTHTAKNAPAAIHHCFHGLHRRVKKMLLVDAGYAMQDFYNACHAAGAKYIITANRASIDAHAHKVTNWKAAKKRRTHGGREVEV